MPNLMIPEVYDAFKDAGASEEKARAAAVAMASYENQFAEVRSTLKLHSWILTTNTALLIALLFLLLNLLSRK